jgi:hypothetical protein
LTENNIAVSLEVKTTIDIPEDLYKKAKIRAIERGVTLKQIVLTSLSKELEESSRVEEPPVSYWANRQLLPDYEAALKEGAFSGGTDSTIHISEDRDAR